MTTLPSLTTSSDLHLEWPNLSQQHPRCHNMSQQGSQTCASCCTQQCCDMLHWNIVIVWLHLIMYELAGIYYARIAFFDFRTIDILLLEDKVFETKLYPCHERGQGKKLFSFHLSIGWVLSRFWLSKHKIHSSKNKWQTMCCLLPKQ